jgi:C4-dicarboxylate-specific signal transduction histidine kinase
MTLVNHPEDGLQLVRVCPLPWSTIDLLGTMLRKLAHDLTNSMVAGISLVDLMQMKVPDAAVSAGLARLRAQLMRPRDTLQSALLPLPTTSSERPQTITALNTWLEKTTEHARVLLVSSLGPVDTQARRPLGLGEAEWVHLLSLLVQNALDAHAAQLLDREADEEVEPPWIRVELTRHSGLLLTISDNGPGCADLVAASQGTLRRVGQGHLGLGLPIAAALADKGGGTLDIGCRQSRGFVAMARFP